jgi:hypothetical protein
MNDPIEIAACPACGTMTFPPTEITEGLPFIGIPIPQNMDDDPRFEGLLFLEPRSMYDQCVIGVVRRFNDRFVLYDQRLVIEQLVQEDPDDPSVPYEDRDAYSRAVEWYEFNMVGAFVGSETPGFLEDTEL